MTEITDLTAEEQMLYWTGAVSRADVMVEHQLNQVFASMTMPLVTALAPSGLVPHISAVRRLLDGDTILDEDLKQSLRDLLNETKGAHEERNRLVHDLWWSNATPGSDPTQFWRANMLGQRNRGSDTRALSDFRNCHLRLNACLFRLISANMLLSGYFFRLVGITRPSPFGPEIDTQNRRIVKGLFEQNEDGTFRMLDSHAE